jgi:hypothetical protein
MNEPHTLSFVTRLREQMQMNHFLLAYRGKFSQEVNKGLLALAERKLNLEGTAENLRKKVFHVMVECLQNICKTPPDQERAHQAVIMIGRDAERYVVYTGNIISNALIERFRERISGLNEMSKEEKRELYRKLILSEDLAGETGIDLGLVDIAKRSGNKLEFDFESIDEHTSFFSLRTLI